MNVQDVLNWLDRRGGAYDVTRMDYDGSNRVIYIGVAPRGSATSASVWQVFRLTYTGNNVTLIDTALQEQIWDDRATLTYA